MILIYFSQFLFLSALSPTLLRITAGVFFGYIAYKLIKRSTELSQVKFPLIGRPKEWLIWASAFITGFVGLLLVVGLMTQLAAVIGIIIVFKHLLFIKYFGHYRPLPITSYVLLFIICVSLFVTGPGLYGFDLPLY